MVALISYTIAFVALIVTLSVIVNRIEHHFYLRETVAAIQYAIQQKNSYWEEELLP